MKQEMTSLFFGLQVCVSLTVRLPVTLPECGFSSRRTAEIYRTIVWVFFSLPQQKRECTLVWVFLP